MTQASARADDEDQVRALVEELEQGWNEGDGARFAAAFTEDGDLVGFDGTFLRGRKAIEQFQQQLLDRWMRGTRLAGRVVDVRFVGPDMAVVHVVGGTIMRRKDRPARARDSIQTLTAVRTGEGWRITAFQNTRIRPMGSSFPAVLHWMFGDALWGLFRLSTDPSGAIGAP
jgi:uncharacterized protein (TIGR02246 family)